jgi:hypothetical protein
MRKRKKGCCVKMGRQLCACISIAPPWFFLALQENQQKQGDLGLATVKCECARRSRRVVKFHTGK